jgi:hypothetical protein
MNRVELLPGGSATLRWRRAGGKGRIRGLKLMLVGREEATDSSGSGSVTRKSVFHEELAFETEVTLNVENGHAEIAIPPTAIPSFESANNRLRWLVVLRAQVVRMPDVLIEREITVLPPSNVSLP